MKLLLQKMLTILGVGGEGWLMGCATFLAPLCCFSFCFWILISSVILGPRHHITANIATDHPAHDDLASRSCVP